MNRKRTRVPLITVNSESRNRLAAALSLPEELPITSRRSEIVQAIRDNQVLVLAGETGSGKSTQIPKLCLEAGRGAAGLIGCTQPRRIAAVSVAERVASEMGQKCGLGIGYKIRFQQECGPETVIKFLTDGMLLSEAHGDPRLGSYDTIIIDEAHERSLNIDFLIGLLRNLLPERPDLKLIITSATIDTKKFSEAFDKAPVIEVSGRTFPVEVIYHPPEEEEGELSWPERVIPVFQEVIDESRDGDILVFLPTEQDIHETCEKLASVVQTKRIELLPLFSRLPQSEQQKIFRASENRKVIVATNIAETSLTIPGIRFVIDTGVARILHYHPASGTYGLPVEPVARSSADQRKGRSGRVENGICHRLYSEEDYLSRKEFTPPEIVRTNLAEVVIRMVDLGIEELESFPFIDPPSKQGLRDAVHTLEELGALEVSHRKGRRLRLTRDGRLMAKLPLDPRLSRVLIQGARECCLPEILPVVAALTIQDPREYPREKAGTAREKHAFFSDADSDFLFYRNLWKYLEARPSAKETKKACQEYYLSFRRIQEWRDIHNQLKQLVRSKGFETSKRDLSDPKQMYTAIHRSLLAGFLSHIAIKGEGHEYLTTRNRSFFIFPGSILFSKGPDWGFALEYVKTTRVYGRTMARIDPDWLPELGRHLIRRRHYNPRWDRKSGTVMIAEEQTLFGFVVKKGYEVPCGTVNPETAADLFIRSVFIDFDLDAVGDFPFLSANRKLIAETEQLENKLRRRGFVVDPEDIYQLFKERLPPLFDIRMLNRHIRENGDKNLYLTREDLLRNDPGDDLEKLYPDYFDSGEKRIPLKYSFDPGRESDGVSFRIKAEDLSDFPFDKLDWVVPGLLPEKIESTLRTLPKEHRKKLIPIQTATEIIREKMETYIRGFSMISGNLPDKGFYQILYETVRDVYGVRLEAAQLSDDNLPEHLKYRFELYNRKGELLAGSRNRGDLYRKGQGHSEPPKEGSAPLRRRYEQASLTGWPETFPPEEIPVKNKKGEIAGTLYPALVPEGDGVSLRLLSSRSEAAAVHPPGVAVLARKWFEKELKAFRSQVKLIGPVRLALNQFSGGDTFERDLFDKMVDGVLAFDVRTKEEFQDGLKQKAPLIFPALEEQFRLAGEALEVYIRERRDLESLKRSEPLRKGYLENRLAELNRLMELRLFALNPADFPHWGRLPAILSGVLARARKGILDPQKDAAREDQYLDFEEGYLSIMEGLPAWLVPEKRLELENFVWLLLEWKTVLFNPEIRLKRSLSESFLAKELARLSENH